MALVWQKTLSLDRSNNSTYSHISRGTLPHPKTEFAPPAAQNKPFLQFQRLREHLVQSRKAFLNVADCPVVVKSAPTVEEQHKAENAGSEPKKHPSKKISFKIKKTSSIYRRNPPAIPKITTISANKVAELTQKFNRMVAENSALLEEPKFRKLVKRVNSQRSSDSDCVKVHRNPSVKTKEFGAKVTRKPSLKTKPNRADDKNVVIVTSSVHRRASIKSNKPCDKNSSDKDDTVCVRAKISYLESPQVVQKSETPTIMRPKTLTYRTNDVNINNNQVSPNSGTVKAAIEKFERKTLETATTTSSTLPRDAPKHVPKPKVPEKNFTLKTREVIAKNYKYKMIRNEGTYAQRLTAIVKKNGVDISNKVTDSSQHIKQRKIEETEHKQLSNDTQPTSNIDVNKPKISCGYNNEKAKVSSEVSETTNKKTSTDTPINEVEIPASDANENENKKTDFEEEKVQIVNIPATLPPLKCDSNYETLILKRGASPRQLLTVDIPFETDDLEKPEQSTFSAVEMKPNTSFLWSRNVDRSSLAPHKASFANADQDSTKSVSAEELRPPTGSLDSSASGTRAEVEPEVLRESPKETPNAKENQQTKENLTTEVNVNTSRGSTEDDLEALYDFVDPKASTDVASQVKEKVPEVPQVPPRPNSLSLRPPNLPPKNIKPKQPLPKDDTYEELNNNEEPAGKTPPEKVYEEIIPKGTRQDAEAFQKAAQEKGYEEVDGGKMPAVKSAPVQAEEKVYEELNPKELDNGYEYCESSTKYEEVGGGKSDDGYEYCARPHDDNIYETLPAVRSPPLLSRRQQQEPLPPRPPSRSSYCTVQNGEAASNCYESIYNPAEKKDAEDVESGTYESIYGCQIRVRDGTGSNRDSVVSSDQQSNSLYGRYFSGFGGGGDASYYGGKATSELSSSDRSDEWVDMSDNEDRANSSIIIVRERQKNKKTGGWSQQFREQWSKSPKKLPVDQGVDSDSDHHYETLATVEQIPHDDDYDSFDTDSESETSFSKVNLNDSGLDIANSQLPDPPNSQAYVLTRLAATAGKHMRKLRRNWSLTKNDISRSLSRMTKRKSRADLETTGITRKEETRPREEKPAVIFVEPRTGAGAEPPHPRLIQPPPPDSAPVLPYQNLEFAAAQGANPAESTPSPGDKGKSIAGFLSKFRRSMSMNPEAAGELTAQLEHKPKSTFYLTDTIDVDGGRGDGRTTDGGGVQTSPDSGISVSPPSRRNNRSTTLTRPQSPPPPAPVVTTTDKDKKCNKKDKRSTSWYAEVGLFRNTENPTQNQPRKPSTFWYAEVGLYNQTTHSTPSTSSAENSGNNTGNVDIKASDFINQDNSEEYYNMRNESEYYNSSVQSFSSTETKKDQSLTNLAGDSDIQLRLQDEPLYQFYDAAVLESVCKDGTNDSDSDGYEEVGNKKDMDIRRPSAMDLVCPKRNSIAFTRTLWCEIPEVIQSTVLSTLSTHQRKIQEAKFEMITSEASYLNSLNVLNDHFITNLNNYENVSKADLDVLFGKVAAVKECSEKLLLDLEKCWQDSILLNGVCDVVQMHAEENFSVYVTYCENQVFLDDTLKNLKEKQSIYDYIRKLESSPTCQSLSLYSFLLLPMQRITRWPLLMDAILKRLSPQDSEYTTCQYALATLNKIVSGCNEAARTKEREKEMKKISSQLEFGKGGPPIEVVSPNRWLIRSGPVTLMVPRNDETLLTFGKRFSKSPLHLFLFNDLLFVTNLKAENCFNVVHYCPKNLVELNTTDMLSSLPVKDSQGKNLMFLTILENQDERTVELLLSCNTETDKERWIEALSPPKSEDPDETLYECWDCPQVTAVHNYVASQPDELQLSRGDIVNVLRKMADGWYHGERIRDGQMGWFPANYTAEIANPHVRARNLKQRYRLLALSESYLKSK